MAPFPTPTRHSLEDLPHDSSLRSVYPEDTFPNGHYYLSLYGRTRYWVIGPDDGNKVVLIHGISIPSIMWKDIATALVAKDCNVLLYDTYGRGYSEAPELPSDTNLYILQLAMLMQYIHWDSADIIGFATGGAIAAAFTAAFPHLVRMKVALIAPSGMLTTAQPTNVHPPPIVSQIRNLQAEHLPGFVDALTSTRREGLVTGLRGTYELLGKTSEKQFLIIQGTEDAIVPLSHAEQIAQLVPRARLVTIEGASHFLLVEDGHKDRVADLLVQFFSLV